jgi:hypothetical protein
MGIGDHLSKTHMSVWKQIQKGSIEFHEVYSSLRWHKRLSIVSSEEQAQLNRQSLQKDLLVVSTVIFPNTIFLTFLAKKTFIIAS